MPLSPSAEKALRERFAKEKATYNGRKSDKTREKDLARYKEKLAFHEEQLAAQSGQRTGAPRRALGSYESNHAFMKRLYKNLIRYVDGLSQLAAVQPQ
jgi:hypothetical protein